MEHVICPRELLPTVESALAAIGYQLETLLQKAINDTRITVMTRDAAVVALREHGQQPMADITLFGLLEEDTLTIFAGLARLMPPHLPPFERHATPTPFRQAEKVTTDVQHIRTGS